MGDLANDKALQKFADLMVKKLSEVDADWNKPWFTTTGHGLPQNIEGRIYNGINSFMLYLLQEENSYKTPVYMTFAQAKKQDVYINKGEKSFPVLFWNFLIKDDSGNKISMDEYKALSKEEQKDYTVIPYTKPYTVFNVDQTNFSEVYPERWKALQDKFNVPEIKDEKGMLSCPELDSMLKHETWLCPIISTHSDRAFFRPSEDKIYLPLKGQFYTGEGFYSTMLHEMAHSTGTDTRLGRELRNTFGDPKYAKEELVAEFTAAVSCRSLGIVSGIREENAQYLKNWLGAIKKEPAFLYSVLSDVGKASTMILNEVCKYELLKNEEQEKQQEEGKHTEESRKVDESKAFSDTRNEKDLAPAFNIALAAALTGSFQELMKLKDQGHQLSEKEINILKGSDSKVRIAAQNIFNIKISDPAPVQQLSELKNRNEVKQLSFNF